MSLREFLSSITEDLGSTIMVEVIAVDGSGKETEYIEDGKADELLKCRIGWVLDCKVVRWDLGEKHCYSKMIRAFILK